MKMTLEEFLDDMEVIGDEKETQKNCLDALEGYYWKNGPRCPFCGEERRATKLKLRKHRGFSLYQCKNKKCRKQFNVFTKTPFFYKYRHLVNWFKIYWYHRARKPIKEMVKEVGMSSREVKARIAAIEMLKRRKAGHVLWVARNLWVKKKNKRRELESHIIEVRRFKHEGDF